MTLSQELERLLREHGAALVGYGDLRSVAGCDYPVGVSVAIPLPPEIVWGIEVGPTLEYREIYRQWNARLDEIVSAGAAFLEERGWRAFAQTTAVVHPDEEWRTRLPHKTVATRAGLGWIGKSCLLVTPQYGSALRLSSLLTDAPLEVGTPIDTSRCGGCQLCQRACPAQAIQGTLWSVGVDRDDIVHKDQCYQKQLQLMRERTGVEQDLCGRCFVVCPYTRGYLKRASGGSV